MGRKKIAFITGITGQDGAYLAQFLLEKDYVVHGLVRWDSYEDQEQSVSRLLSLGIDQSVTLHYGDVIDAGNIAQIIKKIQPDEIYNLAALSQVGVSFETPATAIEFNTKGLLSILDAVRLLGLQKHTRIYQASSSEMYGASMPPQNENTPMQPCSPYGISKLAAYWLARSYRESYGMFVANGILFNHESALRGEDFVTKKITKAVAQIEAGRMQPLMLGNLNARRDWGHSVDYVRGMWMMLQHQKADDFVLATGEAYSVRTFVERAFSHIGISLQWQGGGLDEKGVDPKTSHVLVAVDKTLFRANEVHALLGDATKAKSILGWEPSIKFDDLVRDMMDIDRIGIKRIQRREGAVMRA